MKSPYNICTPSFLKKMSEEWESQVECRWPSFIFSLSVQSKKSLSVDLVYPRSSCLFATSPRVFYLPSTLFYVTESKPSISEGCQRGRSGGMGKKRSGKEQISNYKTIISHRDVMCSIRNVVHNILITWYSNRPLLDFILVINLLGI